MRVFVVPEFSSAKYQGTLFVDLEIADDRNPIVIERDPIPPLNRVIAFGGNTKPYAVWPAHKLDGSPDFRYNPVLTGGGETWIEFPTLLSWLETARSRGDAFQEKVTSGFPTMIMTWNRSGQMAEAAVLTAVEGWTRPIYFKGGFEDFSDAVDRLIGLKSQIVAGAATSEDRGSIKLP